MQQRKSKREQPAEVEETLSVESSKIKKDRTLLTLETIADEDLVEQKPLKPEDWYNDRELRLLGSYFELQHQYIQAVREALEDYKNIYPELCREDDEETSWTRRDEIVEDLGAAILSDGLDTGIIGILRKYAVNHPETYTEDMVDLADKFMTDIRVKEKENPSVLSVRPDMSESGLLDILTWNWREEGEELPKLSEGI